ncbi:IclR family transcriptional regulator [Hydrogenophaga sp. PAMC20947]|nr:IclR family transcriptional regulator [Hydrogenophaga sp. PAMC20947]
MRIKFHAAFAERSSILSAEQTNDSGSTPESEQAGARHPRTPAPQARKPKEDRHFVTALARGLEVLSCFRHGEITLSNQELAQRCKLPKSTVSRLTMTLTKLGYLIHVQESGRYRLGTACLALGSALLNKLDVRKIARPMMMELAEFSGASVSLGVRDKLSMIYVENCRSTAALTLTLDVGSRMPLATSAMGRAWLAAVAQDERQEAMEQIRELDHLSWPKVKTGIDKALEDYQALGITCSFGDWNKEVNGVARAFDPGNGLPIMAVNVGGPSYNLSPKFLLDEVRPRLLQVVRSIEEALPT